MKKLLLSICAILIITLFSCENSVYKNTDEGVTAIDTSLMVTSDTYTSTLGLFDNDTVGLYMSPIKVIKSRLVTREYSNYKDINVTYKNTSSKDVAAIKFRWYGKNAFSEPADMGGVIAGIGGGFTDNQLKAGRTTDSEWDILSKNAKTITIAYPYEVVYEDGTTWKLK